MIARRFDQPLKWSGYLWTVMLLFCFGCREAPWEPAVVALVDGRPIAKASVDRVLEWGLYTRFAGDQNENAAAIQRVIGALIDEELIAEEARKTGLAVSADEVEAAFGAFEASWFGKKPLAAEAAELREALRKQLILRKMTEKVMAENLAMSPDEWREFWDKWPKTDLPRYRVRVMMLPPEDEARILPDAEKRGLEKLAEHFEKEGMAVIISDPFWLKGDRLEEPLAEELARAWEEKRPTGPHRLAESRVIYEVAAVEPAPTLDEQFKAAKISFEVQAGEQAFQLWLNELRDRAVIRVNPAYNF